MLIVYRNASRWIGMVVLLIGLLLNPSLLRAEEPINFNFLIDTLRKDDGVSMKDANRRSASASLGTNTSERRITLRPIVNRPTRMTVSALAPARKSNQASKRGIGSAGILAGTVHMQHYFLSDKGSSWTDFEKTQVRRKLNEAYSFINLQSRKHNKRVMFVDDFADDIAVGGRIPRDAHADPKWTEHVIGMGEDGSAENLIARVKRETEVDHVIICLHVNKSALSYNLAYYDNVAPAYAAERMVCFAAYPDGRETSAATYAHEVLHLFGAGDLYFPYDQTEDRKEEASRLFPNDIMFRVDYDIFQLNVGEFTAYRVGWARSLDSDWMHLED